jgi:hypothetical protein
MLDVGVTRCVVPKGRSTMIATDKFVFIHLPRGGGTFVTNLIKKFFPAAHELGQHLPRELLPPQYSHLPLLGTVRNPWDFYVSLYHYVWPKDAKSILASWMSENGRLGFEGSIRNLLDIAINNERLDQLIEMLPEPIDYTKRNVPGVGKETMLKVRDTGLGYYTLRFNQMFGNGEDVFFCRLENLRNDLVAFFETIGIATEELRDYVLTAVNLNAADHFHYSTYYTSELAEMVSLRDRSLIDRFGYTFEEALILDAATRKISE